MLCYKTSENVTIDIQLFISNARCPFTQYKPQKLDKFDIELWLAADVRSKYLMAFYIVGKNENRSTDEIVYFLHH